MKYKLPEDEINEEYADYQKGGIPAEVYWDRISRDIFETLDFWGESSESQKQE